MTQSSPTRTRARGPRIAIRRALISVSDKSGIVAFARALHDRGVDLLSTGGTARAIAEAGVAVRDVSDYTGFPEMMQGRVKTLHPKIHGAILGRRDIDEPVMAEHGIEPIDLVVVNLYPFEATVAEPGCDLATAIENIDIGGPALLRAAAKNHDRVCVVVHGEDHERILRELDEGGVTAATRFELAARAFRHTAQYDGAISNWLSAVGDDGRRTDFPASLHLHFDLRQTMRYGENPHQRAALYVDTEPRAGSLARASVLQGKALSYNNVADADAALQCVRDFDAPACVIVKHANPCGVAVGDTPLAAWERAWRTDPTSAFGGIIAFNRTLDAQTAAAVLDRQFVEVIVAPEVSQAALDVLARKESVRVLATGEAPRGPVAELVFRRISGGLLVQDRDTGRVGREGLRVVTRRVPTARELEDLLFAWNVARHVRSNAIVYARDGATVGVGAGQMSRVYSARIAAIKAADEKLEVRGAVMASDAFFPFRDGIDAAHEAGITAVIEPGGSMRDEEVIAAADEHGMAMVFTGMRHFLH